MKQIISILLCSALIQIPGHPGPLPRAQIRTLTFAEQAISAPLVSAHGAGGVFFLLVRRLHAIAAALTGDADFHEFWRARKRSLVGIAVGLGAYSLLTVSSNKLSQYFCDSAAIGPTGVGLGVMVFLATLVLAFGSVRLLHHWTEQRITEANEAFTRELRERLFRSLLRQEPRIAAEGELPGLYDAASTVAQRNVEHLLKRWQSVLHVVFGIIVLSQMNAGVAWTACAATVLLTGWSAGRMALLRQTSEESRLAINAARSAVEEITTAEKWFQLRANRLEDALGSFLHDRFQRAYDGVVRHSQAQHRHGIRQDVSSGILLMDLPMVWAILNLYLFHQPSLGQMLAIVSLSWHIHYKISGLFESSRQFAASQFSLDQVRAQLSSITPANAEGDAITQSDIRCRNLGFQDDGQWILRGVDFNLPAGKTLQVLGESGAGKTTLLRMLAGILSPSSGHIEIGGKAPRSVLRDLAYVSQDYPFFRAFSIRENLLLFKPDATDAELHDALSAAAADFVGSKWNAPMTKLSGGERQRLALAGALLRKPSVLFLDEPARSLDEGNRLKIETTLRALQRQGVTLVIAAHEPLPLEGYQLSLEKRIAPPAPILSAG